jgi:hypothetical protein
MKRATILLLTFFAFSLISSSQAFEDKVEYDKKKQDAFAIEFAFSPEAVEGAFIEKMEKLGYKAKEEKGMFNRDKGFIVFKNALVSDISDARMDYIVKVERKSRREKDESVLYMILNKDGNNAMSQFSSTVVGKARSFLNDLLPNVEAFDLELQIKDQENTVAKAEKKLKDLKNDQESIEKKIKDLQDDLKKNSKDQEDAQKDIEDQKVALEALKGKRKNN